MNCLFYLLLLPIYCFIIIFSLGIYFIYFFISIIINIGNYILSFFTKKDYNYSYKKPNFYFKKVIITNDNFKNNNIKKRKKEKIIDVEIEEEQ